MPAGGYAVAHIDVRGTCGFGRACDKAGDFELGGKVVADLEDGVRHLIHTGRIDPRHVAIMGFGAGGIAALYTSAVSKDFHAVVMYNADIDLTTQLDQMVESPRRRTFPPSLSKPWVALKAKPTPFSTSLNWRLSSTGLASAHSDGLFDLVRTLLIPSKGTRSRPAWNTV